MKKQILFLVLFVLATFVNVSKSYGQCTGTPLTPAPGIEYDYGVTITGTNTSPTFLWYATTDVNLLTGTKLTTADAYFTVGTGSAYNNTTGGTNNLKLTWLPKAIGTTFYLVVKYTETSAPGCTVENMKVYEVKPINTFLLAITGSNATGANVQDANCVSAITGAVVTPGASPTVKYTYGTNTIYYEITATGILGNWKPSVRIPALAGDQTWASAEWSSDNGATWTAMTGFTVGGATQDLGLAADATVTNATTGSSYIDRLVINNNNYETLADQVLNVKVDGFLPTAYTESDIQGSPSGTPCAPEAPFGKNADYTITHRPTIDPVPATGNFITKNP